MCLIIPRSTPFHIAEKDIEVYKIVRVSETGKVYPVFYSNQPYIDGLQPRVHIKETDDFTFFGYEDEKYARENGFDELDEFHNFMSIGPGYHSSTSKEFLLNDEPSVVSIVDGPEYIIVTCLIPKGSMYIIHPQLPMVVSDQIFIDVYNEIGKHYNK